MSTKYKLIRKPQLWEDDFATEESAKSVAQRLADQLAHEIFDGRVVASRSPIVPIGTPEHDGKWETTYNIFSGDHLVATFKVREV